MNLLSEAQHSACCELRGLLSLRFGQEEGNPQQGFDMLMLGFRVCSLCVGICLWCMGVLLQRPDVLWVG